MTEPVLSPTELRQLQRRHRHLQAEVAQLGWIAPRLPRKVGGKIVTTALPRGQAEAFA